MLLDFEGWDSKGNLMGRANLFCIKPRICIDYWNQNLMHPGIGELPVRSGTESGGLCEP